MTLKGPGAMLPCLPNEVLLTENVCCQYVTSLSDELLLSFYSAEIFHTLIWSSLEVLSLLAGIMTTTTSCSA